MTDGLHKKDCQLGRDCYICELEGEKEEMLDILRQTRNMLEGNVVMMQGWIAVLSLTIDQYDTAEAAIKEREGKE